MEQEKRPEIPPGTLYMLVLKTLTRLGPMHGYGIAQHVHRISDEVLQVEEGSLYPALQRMLIKGWVIAEWKARRCLRWPGRPPGSRSGHRGRRGDPPANRSRPAP